MKRLVSFFGQQTKLLQELNDKAAEYAKTKNIEFVWVPQKTFNAEDIIDHLNHADAGLIDVEPYTDVIFNKMNERCRLLIRFGVGFDNVDLSAASRHGICVARTTGANKTGVAEMALAQILAIRRQIMINRKTVESGVWIKNIGNEIIGAKVGILGFGHTGVTLAKLLSGFDCEILVYDKHKNKEKAKELGARIAELEEIFTTCDVISVHLPYNKETHALIDGTMFAKMKRDAVIVCTARGNIIDEEALYYALKENVIGGAGLDVYAEEPLPKASKLTELDNIILTPHVSGQTVQSLRLTYKKAIDIMADFYGGKELEKSDLLNPNYKEFNKEKGTER